MQGLRDLNTRPEPLGERLEPGFNAELKDAVMALMSALECDNTADTSSPENETWIGHCGEELRVLCRVAGLDIDWDLYIK